MFTNIRNFGAVLTVVILICFYVPLSTYYIWNLYSKTYKTKSFDVHSCVFLRQRYSSLSLIASMAYIIQFFDLSAWIFVYTDWYNKDKYQVILVSISSTIHIITQFIITIALTLRFWLITFRMKFEMMSENHEWKKIINSNYERDEQIDTEHSMYNVMNSFQNRINSTEFVLKHKKTFGNHRWCIKRVIVIFIILLILILFTESMNYKPHFIPNHLYWIKILFSFVIYLSFGILWSILLFLHCRSPKFSDSLFIKNELSYILQTMMFFLLIYIIFIIVFGLGLSKTNVYQNHYFNEIIILFHVIAFSNMLMLYVIIFYPLKKSKHFSKVTDREISVSREQSVTMSNIIKQQQRNHRNQNQKQKQIKLDHVLRSKFGYDAFIQHLSSEFSMENLLSMTEFLQFKLYLHRKNKQSVMNKELRYWFNLLPLDTLPRSEIVYAGDIQEDEKRAKQSTFIQLVKQRSISSKGPEEDEENDEENDENDDLHDIVYDNDDLEFIKQCKLKGYELYDKYIKVGCEYEINISYELRLYFKGLMDNKDEWIKNKKEFDDLMKLRDIFDDINAIMKRLINHSFTRFKNSKYFEKVKKDIFATFNILKHT